MGFIAKRRTDNNLTFSDSIPLGLSKASAEYFENEDQTDA
jgi:hypothetical protein